SILATSHHCSALRKSCSTLTPSERIYFGISVVGPQTITSAPCFCKQRILDSATRECNISPIIATLRPATSPKRSRIENESNKAWVGCSCAPSPALTICASICLLKKTPAPAYG